MAWSTTADDALPKTFIFTLDDHEDEIMRSERRSRLCSGPTASAGECAGELDLPGPVCMHVFNH